MNELSPIVSEFDSEEAAEAYDAWFRAKVAASLADDRPVVAHDDAMAQVRAIIDGHNRAGKHACGWSGAAGR
ncbi:stability determinant [Sphingomonas sp. OV641]|uniref:type II toxin-antitoxin system RelB family antitoxin n=1 Tax=Sphingomonas sp. OV641 TaxID=1881068 RepID=UPI000A8BBFEA|nr:stability determinant [Sphingomonas sp. OV641]